MRVAAPERQQAVRTADSCSDWGGKATGAAELPANQPDRQYAYHSRKETDEPQGAIGHFENVGYRTLGPAWKRREKQALHHQNETERDQEVRHRPPQLGRWARLGGGAICPLLPSLPVRIGKEAEELRVRLQQHTRVVVP